MAKVKIPFSEFMAVKVKQGKKHATSRNKKYGEEGDWFLLVGRKFCLVAVFQMKLKDVARHHYALEGFDSPEEFIAYWIDLHKRKGFDPEQFVWYHAFVEVDKK